MSAWTDPEAVDKPSSSEVQAQIHYRLIEQLSASERRYRLLVENLRNPVFQCDRSGRLSFTNRAWNELLGRPQESDEDSSLLDYTASSSADVLKEVLDRVARARDGEAVSGEIRVHPRRGAALHVRISLRESPDGEIVGSLTNLTEQKRIEESLKQAKEAAEETSRLKSSFLANMSHEIRTPLAALLGFAEMLQREDLAAGERRGHVERIRDNGRQLLALVDDILDFSKIESDHMDISSEAFEPCRLIDDLLSSFSESARAKGLRLAAVWRGDRWDEPLFVSDPVRLRQILSNLLSNAIKFTSEGSVQIAVTTDAAKQRIQFSVEDSGIGIEPEQVEVIFEPFRQADATTTRRFGGTGLGLAISQRLARLLGGEIRIESEPGSGSRLTVDLPLRTAHLGEAAAVSTDPRRSIPRTSESRAGGDDRVLLVEDTDDLAILMTQSVRDLGLQVDVAHNGAEAVEAVELAAEAPYSAVLMDMQMPVMDGYSAARALRAGGYKGLLIALTAHAMRGDRAKCLQAGCDDYLAKPFRRKDLQDLLRRHLQVTV